MNRKKHFTKEAAEEVRLDRGHPKAQILRTGNQPPRSSSSSGRKTHNLSIVELQRPVTDPGSARISSNIHDGHRKGADKSREPSFVPHSQHESARLVIKGWPAESSSYGEEIHRKVAEKSNQTVSSPRKHSNKSQNKLSGDQVLFTDSPSVPGVQIVYRLDEDRRASPEKLYLDRRKLTCCPIIEGEENLRLLNFQHNFISKIQRLSSLRRLIFLDFYDNDIEEIMGLSTLKSLRVLMLGKNRIRRIENLHELRKLDVLDLHGNKISRIENLSHLSELRVLNLAGNQILHTAGLSGLVSLTELNLRRNKISKLYEMDELPNLQRLFLSFNSVTSIQDIHCLSKSRSLIEVSLDGNDIAHRHDYRQNITKLMAALQQLDMITVTDEERRIANVMTKRAEERQVENEKRTSLREQRHSAIDNAHNQWLMSNERHKIEPKTEKLKRVSPADVCHLAEIDGQSLNIFGNGALDAIEKNWGEKSIVTVTTVAFNYVSFDAIIPYFNKLRSRFISVVHLSFTHTNISTLAQINALASFRRLDSLTIEADGNPVTAFTLWKSYVLFRLAHLSLKKLDGIEISDSDVKRANDLFDPLECIATLQRPYTSYDIATEQQRSKIYNSDVDKLGKRAAAELKQRGSRPKESILRALLTYEPKESVSQVPEPLHDYDHFSKNFIQEIVQLSYLTNKKQSTLDDIWPELVRQIVNQQTFEMQDLSAFGKRSLDRLQRDLP